MQVNVQQINSGKVQGYHLAPDTTSAKGIIITFGGSEGSSWLSMGHKIAEAGYTVLSLYYFGKGPLPCRLNNIDLDFFDDIIEYIKTSEFCESTITIVGASRGAELALLLAAYYPLITNVALFSPSAYVFSGMDHAPSWRRNNEALPFITFSKKTVIRKILNRKLPLRDLFEFELRNNRTIDQSKIDSSNIKGNILIFAGKNDLVWPSEKMGEIIRIDATSANEVEMVSFENAGHSFNNDYYDGGDMDGNLYAYYKSQEILHKKLSDWHYKGS